MGYMVFDTAILNSAVISMKAAEDNTNKWER